MGVDEQIAAFERWSDEQGLATRDIERRRVIHEILEIARGEAVSSIHIDQLIRRYRDGLMGGRSVLTAQRVGDELIEWQASGSAHTENTEAYLEFDLDAPGAVSSQAAPLPASSFAPAASSFAPDAISVPPARSQNLASSQPSALHALQQTERSFAPIALEGTPGEASSRPVEETLERPRALSEAPQSLSGMDVDSSAKHFATGRSRPPSRAPANAVIPDVEISNEGVSEERKLRAQMNDVDSIAPAPGDAPAATLFEPAPEAPHALRPVVTRVDTTSFLSAHFGTVAFAVLLVGFCVALLVTKPSCLFADSAKPVSGPHVSTHLGLAWDFPEPWLHAENLDDDATVSGDWRRAVSLFFHGRSANDFQSQIAVVTFSRKGKSATEDDARQLGANEVVGAASLRQCEPFDLRGISGTRCTATSARMGRPTGLVEVYFLLDGKAVFFRYQFEIPLFSPPKSALEAQSQSQQLDEHMAERIQHAYNIVFAMRTLKE